MVLKKIILLRLVIIAALFQNPIQLCSQSKGYDCSGLWKSKDDSILVYKIGQKRTDYLVNIVRKSLLLPCSLNQTEDSLIFHTKDDKINSKRYFLISKGKGIIFDELGMSGKRQYFEMKDQRPTFCNLKDITVSENIFFDFSTTGFCAGNSMGLGAKSILPFKPNQRFIKSKSIDSLKITGYSKIISKYCIYSVKEYDFLFIFNKNGEIAGFNSIHYAADTGKIIERINWNYVYSEDHLKQIIVNTVNLSLGKTERELLTFDEDGWTIDQFGQKKCPNFSRQILEFSYDDKSKLPKKAIAKCLPGRYQPSILYQYNAQNQLNKIVFVDPSGSNERSEAYSYDSNAALRSITTITKKIE